MSTAEFARREEGELQNREYVKSDEYIDTGPSEVVHAGQLFVDTGEPPPWLDQAGELIIALGKLQPGWNSHVAATPSGDVIHGARTLLLCLANGGATQPHINPTPEGGIQFEWEEGTRYLEVEVMAMGAAEYFYQDSHANVEEEGVVFAGEQIETILDLIRSVG